MPSREALNSECAVGWFVGHVSMVTTSFPLAKGRDILEEMLHFGFPFNVVLKKSR